MSCDEIRILFTCNVPIRRSNFENLDQIPNCMLPKILYFFTFNNRSRVLDQFYQSWAYVLKCFYSHIHTCPVSIKIFIRTWFSWYLLYCSSVIFLKFFKYPHIAFGRIIKMLRFSIVKESHLDLSKNSEFFRLVRLCALQIISKLVFWPLFRIF